MDRAKCIAVALILSHALVGGLSELSRYGCLAVAAVLIWFLLETNRPTNKEAASRDASRRRHRVAAAVMDLVCDYDPLGCKTVQRFQPVVKNSRCLFAKSAKLWGSRDYDESKSIEDNVKSSVPMLLQMLLRGEEEGFDGFVIEVIANPNICVNDVDEFANVVRRVLFAISDCDPAGERSARKNYVHTSAWHFVFAKFPIFVTTFAPCYGIDSSRHSYGADSVFILLQPEYSFLNHDIPADTPDTNWEAPMTIRDRIRKSFRTAGQSYTIPCTTHYPAAEHIVPPTKIGGCPIRWWERR